MLDNPIGVLGLGAYVPDRVMTNDEWAEHVDTSDEWIFARTGIKNPESRGRGSDDRRPCCSCRRARSRGCQGGD